MSPSRAKAAGGRFALWTSVKVIAAAILVFILAGIVIPDLVDAHNTVLLLVAVVCGFLTLAIVVWTVVSIRRSYMRLRRSADIHLTEAGK